MLLVLQLNNLLAEEGEPPEGLEYTGVYKNVLVVNTSGLTKWVDYLPVVFVTITDPLKVGTWDNDGAAFGVVTLGSGTGLTAWVDYIPIAEVTPDRANSYDDAGGIRVVEVIPS